MPKLCRFCAAQKDFDAWGEESQPGQAFPDAAAAFTGAWGLCRGLTMQQFEKWAWWWARRYSWALESRGDIDLEDLFQAAMLGILRALEGYQEEQGSWAQYSSYFIRNEIRQLIGIGNTRRLVRVQSLDAPAYEDSDETRLDMLADESAPNAEEITEFNDMRRCVREAVERLRDDRQRQVVQMVYFDGKRHREAAEALGVSQARECSIWHDARRRLARDRRLRDLEDRTPYYMRVGVRTFNSTWTSATEAAALWRIDQDTREASRGHAFLAETLNQAKGAVVTDAPETEATDAPETEATGICG